MTTERIAGLNDVAARLLAAYPGSLTDRAAELLREYAALLATAGDGEPERGEASGDGLTMVCSKYADWQRAGRLAALLKLDERDAEIERLINKVDMCRPKYGSFRLLMQFDDQFCEQFLTEIDIKTAQSPEKLVGMISAKMFIQITDAAMAKR